MFPQRRCSLWWRCSTWRVASIPCSIWYGFNVGPVEAEDSEGTSVSSEEHVKKKVTFQESAQSPAKRQKSRRRSIEQLARKPSSGLESRTELKKASKEDIRGPENQKPESPDIKSDASRVHEQEKQKAGSPDIKGDASRVHEQEKQKPESPDIRGDAPGEKKRPAVEKVQKVEKGRKPSVAEERSLKWRGSFTVAEEKKPKPRFGGGLLQKPVTTVTREENLKKFELMRKIALEEDMTHPLKKHIMDRPLLPLEPLPPGIPSGPRARRIKQMRQFDEPLSMHFSTTTRSSLNMYLDYDVMEILSKLQQSKDERKQDAVNKELNVIMDRVRMALMNIGVDYDEVEQDKEGKKQAQMAQEALDAQAGREMIQERVSLIDRLDKFTVTAVTRKQYLTELMFWFEENLNIFDDCLTEEEIAQLIREAIQMHEAIMVCLNAFERTGDKVVEVGKALLEETGKIIKEKNEMMSRKTRKERIILYDDKILLTDQIKWESATKTIVSVFEDSFKIIKNLNFKNALRLGHRQFDYLMVACEKRYKELDDKKKQCNDLQGKLHSAKIANDKMLKELDEQKKKVLKVSAEVAEKTHALEKWKDKNKELTLRIIELSAKLSKLQEELENARKTPSPPPSPPTPPEPEKIVVKVVDSATQMRIKELELELEQARMQTEELLARTDDLEAQLVFEQHENFGLQEKVIELEVRETPEPPPAPIPPPPPPPSSTPVEVKEKDMEKGKDAAYYRTLMAGVKNEFSMELEKMKNHMKKEQMRNEANVRRLEMQQKEQLTYIQKDTLRMLRAIMHFRDQMIKVLEKENLHDQAQSLSDLGSLLKDKLSPDPREVLAQVVICVIDYLHKVEKILANSFLGMKVMMKYQVEKQVEAELELRKAKEKEEEQTKKVVKDIKKRKNFLKDAKADVQKMAKKLRKTKNKLKRYQAGLEQSLADRKYKALMMRYKQIWKLYRNMQREMDMLQNDFNKTMEQKLEEKETMVVSRIKMEIKQRRAVNEEQLKISIADQKRNLRLLAKAYEENRISKELYTMSAALIQKTLEIPRRKLQHLFEQYIVFRTVNESKERVKQVLEDEDLATDVRQDMESYMDQIDDKYVQSTKKWKMRLSELEFEKLNLFRKIYSLFNEVLLETGILLIHPLLKGLDKSKVMEQAASAVDRRKVKSLLGKRGSPYPEVMMKLPERICGSRLTLEHARARLWSTQIPPAEPTPKVTEPHLLAYDLNREKILSMRTIKANLRDIPVYKAESFNIADQSNLQYIRELPFYQQMKKPVIYLRQL